MVEAAFLLRARSTVEDREPWRHEQYKGGAEENPSDIACVHWGQPPANSDSFSGVYRVRSASGQRVLGRELHFGICREVRCSPPAASVTAKWGNCILPEHYAWVYWDGFESKRLRQTRPQK